MRTILYIYFLLFSSFAFSQDSDWQDNPNKVEGEGLLVGPVDSYTKTTVLEKGEYVYAIAASDAVGVTIQVAPLKEGFIPEKYPERRAQFRADFSITDGLDFGILKVPGTGIYRVSAEIAKGKPGQSYVYAFSMRSFQDLKDFPLEGSYISRFRWEHDADQDGIPTVLENYLCQSGDLCHLSADSDGDGIPDSEEWVANVRFRNGWTAFQENLGLSRYEDAAQASSDTFNPELVVYGTNRKVSDCPAGMAMEITGLPDEEMVIESLNTSAQAPVFRVVGYPNNGRLAFVCPQYLDEVSLFVCASDRNPCMSEGMSPRPVSRKFEEDGQWGIVVNHREEIIEVVSLDPISDDIMLRSPSENKDYPPVEKGHRYALFKIPARGRFRALSVIHEGVTIYEMQ